MDFPTKRFAPYATKVGRYQICPEDLGIGSTGCVKLAKDDSNKKFAVKIVNQKDPKSKEEALREVSLLSGLKHDNIIRIEHVEQLKGNIYIFTEYYDQGDLYSRMQRDGCFGEEEAVALFRQMCAALEFAHSCKICHHDFKLENCVVDSFGQLRVIDFAYAMEFDDNEPIRYYHGSPVYAAPEVLFRKPHNESVDIFSLGICLYFMLTGRFPFVKDESRTTFEQLCRNVTIFRLECPELLSNDVKDLLSKTITKERRLSWREINIHPWCQKGMPHGAN